MARKPNRVGRRNRLTRKLISELCKWIENGNTVKDACRLCMISQSSFYRWLSVGRGETKTPPTVLQKELLDSIKDAEAKYVAFHLGNINTAARKEWKAAAYMLKVKRPEDFVVTEKHEVSGIPANLPPNPILDDDEDEEG